MKCAFIEEYGSGFRVKKMCRTLCVSRSRYYAWKRRSKSFRQQENERLIEKIREAHKLSRRTYGSPRIAKELKENNIPCGKNRVARLMRLDGIYAKTKRRFRVKPPTAIISCRWQKICSTGDLKRIVLIKSGSLTSRISEPRKAGYISRPFWICITARLSGGPWRTVLLKILYSKRFNRP